MNFSYIKTTVREIKNSFGRYIAILAIVFLGVGFFAGLKMTRPSMVASVNSYLHEQNFYDYRLISTLGYTDEQVKELKETPGITDAEGSISADALCRIGDGGEAVYKIHSLPENINKIVLMAGRLPENSAECLVDYRHGSRDIIGSVITMTETNHEDTLDLFKEHSFTVVGTVRSPLYLNFERGTTSVGDGRVAGFFYVPQEVFDCDYVTEIYVKTDADHDIYTDAYNDGIDAGKPAVEEMAETMSMARYDSIVADAMDEVADAQRELDEKKADAQKELDDALKDLQDAEEEIAAHEQEIADGREEIRKAWKQINANEADMAEQEQQLEALLAVFGPIEQYLYGKEQLDAGKESLNTAKRKLREQEQELADGEQELEDAKVSLSDGWKEYRTALADFEKETGDAQKEIDDAILEISDIETPDTYVLTRNQNIGYVCFENDSNIVAAISDVFPVFFFLVAALITMTTMNRMVEEQRTQIGILKALGYTNAAISFKFIFYAGSAALVGAVSGYAVGTRVFPTTIWAAYCIMYDPIELHTVWNLPLAAGATAVALLGAIGTTYLTCRYELTSAPANLIRPKAAKSGKRILLERITFIWSRMKFLRKVSARNLFRYKKRFFMMILGISGCTALLLTGFGLRDSIVDIADMQYDEIQVYDIAISFTDALLKSERDNFTEEMSESFERIAYCYEENVDLDFNGKTKSVYLEVPEDTEAFCRFVHLATEAGEAISYPGTGEAVITSKLAEKLGIRAGDTVVLRDNDMRQLSVKVTALCKNYVYSYIYIDSETYKAAIGAYPSYKSAYSAVSEGMDVHAAAAAAADRKDVLSVSVTLDTRDRIAQMMSSMNYIVLLVIFCAGFLAFIVLYNLTNINITERIREIATIKVLGFYTKETADYVFRENFLLTGMGVAVGLFLGRLLHWFVMYQVNIDMVSFKTYISPQSYVYSVLLTFLFAVLVNGFMLIKIGGINMAESLKSVE